MAIVAVQPAFAQNVSYKKETLSRVDFRNKQNREAKEIPRMLLEAFCGGQIQGYFPKSPTTPMTYQDFLTHFGMPQPQIEQQSDNSLLCLETSCAQLDPSLLNCFKVYMDVEEVEQFDKKHSRMQKKIKYVRLIFSAECNAKGLDYEGPVFHMDELKNLDPTFKVINPQNTAASKNIYDYMLLNLFSSVVIKEGGEYSDNPSQSDLKHKQKYSEIEDSWYEH